MQLPCAARISPPAGCKVESPQALTNGDVFAGSINPRFRPPLIAWIAISSAACIPYKHLLPYLQIDMRVSAPCQQTARAAIPCRRGLVIKAQSYYSQNGSGSNQPGDRILNKLRSPLDLLALPGRVTAGALTSLPELMQKIPADLERLQALASDPRPVEEKQREVLQEIESRVVQYMDAGTNIEADVLNNINSVLPEGVKSVLPPDVKDFLEKPHLHVEDSDGYASTSAASNGFTTTVPMGDSDNEFDMPVTLSPSEIAASQIVSEMTELQAAVLELQTQLAALQSNTDPSKANMLKLNVREAREALRQHLQQLSPAALGTNDPPARAAINEAEQLLVEVAAIL